MGSAGVGRYVDHHFEKPMTKDIFTSSRLNLFLKVSILASGPDTEFKAAGTAHPGYALSHVVSQL